MTRAPVVLAMLPLGVFTTAGVYTNLTRMAPREETPYIRVVTSNDVKRVPLNTATFNDRWASVAFVRYVKTTSYVKPVDTVSETVTPTPKPIVAQALPKHRDTCARHGLRKVQIGKRWRCRR